MRMTISALAVTLSLGLALPALGQGIGVMQSAETIDQGIFKLTATPMMAFGQNSAGDEVGISARGGYGFTDRFDAEAKLAFFENTTLIGADAEYWLLKDGSLDFSLTGGVHRVFGGNDRFDTVGIEIMPHASGHVSDKLELYGALDASFESISNAPSGIDDSYTSLHLVPGIEYRMSENADLVGEFGIGLNENSSEYLGAGVAFYLR